MRRKNACIRREILALLSDGSIMSVNEIALAIHAKWQTTKRHLDRLERYGRKVMVVKKNKRLTMYQLPMRGPRCPFAGSRLCRYRKWRKSQ
jgi:predicted ArsR family transcriptional regulator